MNFVDSPITPAAMVLMLKYVEDNMGLIEVIHKELVGADYSIEDKVKMIRLLGRIHEIERAQEVYEKNVFGQDSAAKIIEGWLIVSLTDADVVPEIRVAAGKALAEMYELVSSRSERNLIHLLAKTIFEINHKADVKYGLYDATLTTLTKLLTCEASIGVSGRRLRP